MKLSGKRALVTGAGRGFGRAVAETFVAEGARVALMSRTREEVEDAASAIGKGAIAVIGDVADEASMKEAVEATVRAFGGIDILVNNAAIIGPVMAIHQVPPSAWDKVMDINLRGAFLASRAAVPHMIRQGTGGRVINITSGLGEMVMPPLGVYSITKAALIHMTRIQAEELMPYGITVNGLDPSVMDTSMQEAIRALGPETLGERVFEEFNSLKESGYLSDPAKVARLAVFLAGPCGEKITGAVGTETDYAEHGYGLDKCND